MSPALSSFPLFFFVGFFLLVKIFGRLDPLTKIPESAPDHGRKTSYISLIDKKIQTARIHTFVKFHVHVYNYAYNKITLGYYSICYTYVLFSQYSERLTKEEIIK